MTDKNGDVKVLYIPKLESASPEAMERMHSVICLLFPNEYHEDWSDRPGYTFTAKNFHHCNKYGKRVSEGD